ncbi:MULTISPECIES: hypothetical protein [unclassified Oceanobacillus]|uniref:hypothetical protein n=1 Tax=unclassified Oceanobacillus TaxID=2630292 RepID=UPI0012EBD185|nr:hypothetical protein [Oceanobacillus sp. AG]
MRKKHAIWITGFFIIYFLTFLPNFGVMNELKFIGFLPQPLAWVLFLNLINTVIIFVIYFKFFKPFALNVERVMQKDEESDQV